MIDFKKYTEFVNAVTSEESKYGGHFQDRLRDPYSKDFSSHRALTAALGLSAEAGEFTEIVKKIVFQGKPVTKENLFHMKRELGEDPKPEEILKVMDALTSIVRYNRSNESKSVGFATEEKQKTRHSNLDALD